MTCVPLEEEAPKTPNASMPMIGDAPSVPSNEPPPKKAPRPPPGTSSPRSSCGHWPWWPVESINRRINARVKAMAADGLIDEVRALHHANRLGRQARKPLGTEITRYRRCLLASRSEPGDLRTTTTWLVNIQNSSPDRLAWCRGKPRLNWPLRQKTHFSHLRWIHLLDRIKVDSGTSSRHRVSLSPLYPLLRIPIGQKEDEFESIGCKNAANLVIVESLAKAKTIQKYLRPLESNLGTFDVQASVGYVLDLPSKSRKA